MIDLLLRNETLYETNEETSHLPITFFSSFFILVKYRKRCDFRYLFDHTLPHFARKTVSRELKRSTVNVDLCFWERECSNTA